MSIPTIGSYTFVLVGIIFHSLILPTPAPTVEDSWRNVLEKYKDFENDQIWKIATAEMSEKYTQIIIKRQIQENPTSNINDFEFNIEKYANPTGIPHLLVIGRIEQGSRKAYVLGAFRIVASSNELREEPIFFGVAESDVQSIAEQLTIFLKKHSPQIPWHPTTKTLQDLQQEEIYSNSVETAGCILHENVLLQTKKADILKDLNAIKTQANPPFQIHFFGQIVNKKGAIDFYFICQLREVDNLAYNPSYFLVSYKPNNVLRKLRVSHRVFTTATFQNPTINLKQFFKSSSPNIGMAFKGSLNNDEGKKYAKTLTQEKNKKFQLKTAQAVSNFIEDGNFGDKVNFYGVNKVFGKGTSFYLIWELQQNSNVPDSVVYYYTKINYSMRRVLNFVSTKYWTTALEALDVILFNLDEAKEISVE